MISGENLHFCAADSNMYIGRIHQPCLSAFFFSRILIFWQKFPFSNHIYQFLFYHHARC